MVLLLTMSDDESDLASADNDPANRLPHQIDQVKLPRQK